METTAEDFQNILSENESDYRKPTVGFGIFGIKAGKRSDIVYDLTVPVIILAVIAMIPFFFVLRRRVIIALYRQKCLSGKKTAAFAAYKKFGKIIGFMKLPSSDGLEYEEYANMLAERSGLFADGEADSVINTALKASFGGSLLTENEAEEMVLRVNTIVKRYYLTLSRFEKLIFKYWYCMI